MLQLASNLSRSKFILNLKSVVQSSTCKRPETEEERKNMQRPFVVQKSPQQVQLQVGKDYYWCACGLSKNQPFCDGSHKGTPYSPVSFKAQKEKVYLCMCKHTKNKSYCDGSHTKLDF